jgi:chromosome segregation ATPase
MGVVRMSQVKEWNQHFKCTVALMDKEEVINELNEQIRILKRDLDIEQKKVAKLKHNFNYTIEKSELAYAKLEKKYNKLNEEYGKLENENLSLRDTLKVVL